MAQNLYSTRNDSDQSDTLVIQESSLPNLTLSQLEANVQEAQISYQGLLAENAMLDRYIKKLDLKAENMDSSPPQNDIVRGSGVRKRSKSRNSAMDRLLKLTAEQKCNIAQIELEDFKLDITKLQEESEKIVDTYKAISEEAEIRLHEIKKYQYEFDRDVVKGGWSDRINAYMSEKLVRHIEERLRQGDTLVDKLRLKNCTLRVQQKKFRSQFRQKEEMGEVLHEVDFEQLKIENTQYLAKIEEKNHELLRLKLMAGKTLVVLNSYKRRLQQLMQELKRVEAELVQRNDLIKRIQTESVLVDKERNEAEHINEKIRQQLSDYRVPGVMDYVHSAAEQNLLKRRKKIYQRKLDIAAMALDRHKKLWARTKRMYPDTVTTN